MTADTAALRRDFEQRYGHAPKIVAEAPGRVNLIGEHTDYNDGFVLPAAIDRTITVAMAPREDGVIRAYSLDYEQSDEFPAARVRRFMGSKGGWRDYVRGIVWALQDEHLDVGGADLSISGDVPQGAGLSSSAAIELAVAGVLTADLDIDRKQLALLCRKTENLFVGVQCGVMDQLASALGHAGHALLIDCRSLEHEAVPLPPGVAIVVIDSGVSRSLADTPFNARREECAEAAQALGLKSLRDADEEMLDKLSGVLQKRARHVVTENRRVLAAVEALKGGDIERLKCLMAASHTSLRDDYEVSTPELDTLVKLATGAGGIGARLTGAGFGGCTVNLVRAEGVDAFTAAVLPEYERKTGRTARAHVCAATDGMRVSGG